MEHNCLPKLKRSGDAGMLRQLELAGQRVEEERGTKKENSKDL